jgi:hypothetical protein
MLNQDSSEMEMNHLYSRFCFIMSNGATLFKIFQ